MVLSMGAATRNVRGGRFRSTIRGFLAQLVNSANVIPAIVIQTRDQKYLRKGIQISPRRRGHRQVFLRFGLLGTARNYQPPQDPVNEFCGQKQEGPPETRRPIPALRLLRVRLPNDGDLETVQALGAVG